MRVKSSHDDFDQLTRFLSLLTGQIDGQLKKQTKNRLTLTSLRVLVVLSGDTPRSPHRTPASIASALGVSRSTMSATIGKLESKDLVSVTRHDSQRNHHVCITDAGRRAAHGAQVTVDDAIGDFMAAMDRELQASFFAAIRSTNETLERIASSKREQDYIDGLKKHDSKIRARGLKPMREIVKTRASSAGDE